jgi:DNA-binding NtrC family response regulator
MGRFREDLFYRLNTVTIHVPPLRDRGKDIPLLFRYFASEFAHKYGRNPIRLTEDAKAILAAYRWPGNVRELRNYTEQLTVLSSGDTLNAEEVGQTLPNNDSYLPVHVPADARSNTFDSERELLFKIIFDLKNDVNDLKGKVMMLMNGQMEIPNMTLPARQTFPQTHGTSRYPEPVIEVNTPLLEESLSLERKEKDLIYKALIKYRNNRKKAAQDLGISERTLYRKIKTYGLEE